MFTINTKRNMSMSINRLSILVIYKQYMVNFNLQTVHGQF